MPSSRQSATLARDAGGSMPSRSSARARSRCSTLNCASEEGQTMPEAYIIPLPPRWERDLDCGWVEFKSGKDDIRGYLAKPKGKRNLPGIVMVHENLGVIEHRQDVTRRLAKAGYATLTVDLYSRLGGWSPRDFTTPEERRNKAFKA